MSSTLVYCVPLSRPALSSRCREYNIFQYPPNKKLINKRWDTYDVTTICSNCELSEHQTSKVGIIRWKCLGH